MIAAVYQDYVHNNGALVMALQQRGITIRFVDAAGIIGGALAGCDLLIMPGGADLYYCEKLAGAGDAAIRDYVAQGGGYLGLCAGAYYACTSLDWDNGAIAGPRALALLDAHAKGPVRDYLEDGDITKSWCAAAALTTAQNNLRVLYNGGPVFERLGPDVETLAHYAQGPAIIAGRFGQGRVVLSSPHVEFTGSRFLAAAYTHRNASRMHEVDVGQTLRGQDAAQDALFDQLLQNWTL